MVIVVVSVDVLVAARLYVGPAVRRFLDLDGRDLLGFAFREVHGQGEALHVARSVFGDLDVVHGSVFVQIQIVHAFRSRVEESFEFLAVARFFEQLGRGSQVKPAGCVDGRELLYRYFVGVAVAVSFIAAGRAAAKRG